MSTINGFDGNSMNTLLSSLGTGSSKSTDSNNGLFGINLSDYASVKNGTYGKLMKAYYTMDESNGKKETNSKNDTDDSDATIKSIKDSTNKLKKSAQELYGNKGLFEKNINGHKSAREVFDPDVIKVMNDSLMIMMCDVTMVKEPADLRKVTPPAPDSAWMKKTKELTVRALEFYKDSEAPKYATGFSPFMCLRASFSATPGFENYREMLIDFVQKDEFPDFFKVVSKLFK